MANLSNEELVHSLVEALLNDDKTPEECGDIIDKIIERMDPAYEDNNEWYCWVCNGHVHDGKCGCSDGKPKGWMNKD